MLRRCFRFLFVLPPLWGILMWGWSYGGRVDIPPIDTFHNPAEPQGGEMLLFPTILRGHVNVRYCRIVPGAPLAGDAGEWHGFGYQHGNDDRYKAGTFVEWNLYGPIWPVVLLTLVYPVIKAVRFVRGPYRRSRRRKIGHCEECGYDLTGNTSGACPECGKPVPASTVPNPSR